MVAVNGLLRIGLAVFLYYQANYGTIYGVFLAVQRAELALGLANLVLNSRNFRDGLRLSGRMQG
ncbi:MAG: hypothetical protein DYG98_16230 [Haliscomenobacteraceae bacterium CHB4]|nr:hypothetical protein [Haliscomenobacteraceae bacterium CHB4]